MTKRKRGFVIRPIEEHEIKAMRDLWTIAGLQFRPKGRDALASLRRQLRHAPDLFLGAFERDRMIGVVIASDDGRKGWINRLAVHPGWRRRGVGAALVRACERALRRRSRRLIAVLIESDNGVSREFFMSTGYRPETDIHYYTKRESDSF